MNLLTFEEVSANAPELREVFEDDTEFETVVEFLLPAITSDFLAIRNREFDTNDSGEPVIPAGAKAVALDMLRYRINQTRYVGITSEKSALLGDAISFTADLVGGYPRSISGRIQPRYIGVI